MILRDADLNSTMILPAVANSDLEWRAEELPPELRDLENILTGETFDSDRVASGDDRLPKSIGAKWKWAARILLPLALVSGAYYAWHRNEPSTVVPVAVVKVAPPDSILPDSTSPVSTSPPASTIVPPATLISDIDGKWDSNSIAIGQSLAVTEIKLRSGIA